MTPCEPHDWKETGFQRRHVEGGHIDGKPLFKYGTPIVTYVRCGKCKQDGYRKPPSMVVYTWSNL